MNRPLRFVLVTTFYPPRSFGGDAVHVRLLARALTGAGHAVDVIHCVDAFDLLRGDAPARTAPADPGVSVHGLHSGYGMLSPLLSQQSGRLLLKAAAVRSILDRCQPDVIHYHNISLFGPEVLTVGPRAGSPLKLYTTHEYWLVCPTHLLLKYARAPCEKQNCTRCVLTGRRPPQLWRYTSMIERCACHVDAFLAPSRIAADLHARFGFGRPMVHLPLFTQRPEPGSAQPAPPHPRPYFLFVGRLEPGKNARALIEAWRRMEGADLLIAGIGSEEASLHAAARANARIRFLGHLDAAELSAFYAHAAACLVPSALYEVFPLVVLEAFAHRTPVIAHDVGALAEMIGESGGGLLYRSELELLAGLTRILANPDLRARLGDNGRSMIDGAWSQEAYLERYFDLLRVTALRRRGAIPWEDEVNPSRPARVPSAAALPQR